MKTVRRTNRDRERGSTIVLTALLVPALVAFAGLGIGGSVVRSAHNETQRTADLAAIAAASSIPNLGRPNVTGLPNVTNPVNVPLPPSVQSPANASAYVSASAYDVQHQASASVDRAITADLGLGPVYQSLMGSIGGDWRDGCNVGEAQYAAGRARMGRSFAAVSDVLPKCATAANTFPSDDSRLYVRPEFESTGMYRLHACMLSPVNCAQFMGQGATQTLAAIGQQFFANSGVSTNFACMVDPTQNGCAFHANSTLFGSTIGADVQAAVRTQFPVVTGLSYSGMGSAEASLETLARLLFGKLTTANVCSVPLGPASGVTPCQVGANLASMLPSVMTPRVRSLVTHAIDVPLVPSWVNGDKPGDFSFMSQALARRTFKNAVVVPTLPASFSATPGASVASCLPGTNLLPNVISSLSFLLSKTIGTLNTLLSALLTSNLGSTCGNAEVEGAANASYDFTLNLNPLLGLVQKRLVAAAERMNDVGNLAANTVIANALNAQDGKARAASHCSTLNPPPVWCVDLGGQAIEDLKDVYDPPSGNQAPTMQEIIQRAAGSGEPVTLVSLGKYVKVNLGAPVTTPAGVIDALTYWIPALDFVPATVQSFNPANPAASTFRVIQNATNTRGLYRAELLEPSAAPRLCTETNDPLGNCADQPPGLLAP